MSRVRGAFFLADVARHIANAIQEQKGTPAAETVDRLIAALSAELEDPTSTPNGGFVPVHS